MGRDLVHRWSEPHRHYHTLAHLSSMLAEADDSPVLHLAIWFHDAIYDPQASDNEERSADLARIGLAGLALQNDLIAEVSRLVLLTKSHKATPTDALGCRLLDLDLQVLGSEPAVYDLYSEAIRREYAHVEESAYRAGRTAVLQRFLQRERIYLTAAMHQAREEPARCNLRREIARLLAFGEPAA